MRSWFDGIWVGVGQLGRSCAFWRFGSVGRCRALILFATLLVMAYAVGVLGYTFYTPEIGIRSAFRPIVNDFDAHFYYGGDSPQRGDVIKDVGGEPIQNWSHYLRVLLELDRTPASAVDSGSLWVNAQGVKIVRVDLERPASAEAPGAGPTRVVAWCKLARPRLETFVPSVLWFFLKVGLFAVGAVVLWKRPADRSAAVFFLFCTMSFGAYLGGYHWGRIVTQPPLIIGFIICSVMLPAASLHFYLFFPRPRPALERHPGMVLGLIYGPPLLFLVLMLTLYGSVRWLYAAGHASGVESMLHLLLDVIYAYFVVAVLWYLASVTSLIDSYRRAADVVERNQVRWILFGTIASLAPIGYSLYLAVFEGARFGGGGAVWPMFAASACVTVAFTISITRYRLMQLDQLLSSGVVYFLISTLAACLYYGVVLAGMYVFGSQVAEGPSVGQALGVATTAVVLMAVLDLARGRVKSALDRHFRREKHQLDHTWNRLSEAIDQLVDPATLARRLLHTASDLLAAPRGAVYLRQGAAPLFLLTDALGEKPTLAELSSGCPLVEALREEGTLSARPGVDPGRRQLQFLRGEVAQALLHEGQLLGFLLLGPREHGAYTPDDFNLLAAFARLTVLALVSAEGRRAIEDLNRELQAKVDKIAEQQRRILALQSQLTGRSKPRVTAEGEAEVAAEPEVKGPPSTEVKSETPVEGLVGSGPQAQALLALVRKVAASDSAVLLRGESGTGKELLAKALHEQSPRAGQAFIKVHCAALSPGLLESELFGHVRGAFTTAVRDKVGRFEAAHGGTLFLDEIGDVNLEVQVKLLRVLQEKTFERVGSSEPVKVDVRVLAATHQDLEKLMREGRFREDLFYRLNVFPIRVPPLRERSEDIAELAQHFLRLHARRTGKAVSALDDDALAALKAYSWPGNVRELENVLERAVVVAEGSVLTTAELPPELLESTAEETTGEAAWSAMDAPSGRGERDRREREQLVRALAAAGGNKAEAARAVGLARSTFLSKLKRLGLG